MKNYSDKFQMTPEQSLFLAKKTYTHMTRRTIISENTY